MSEWSHLANAKHIDLIIAHAKAHPAAWEAARNAVYDAAYEAARSAAWNAVYDAARSAAWNAAFEAARNAAWNAADRAPVETREWIALAASRLAAWDAARWSAWGAILALVAWDRAGDLMDLPAEQVKVLALLGDQAAILLYPAIKIMETTQELV